VNNFTDIWNVMPMLNEVVAMTRHNVPFSIEKVDIIELFISSVDARVYMVSRQYFSKFGYPAG